MRTTGTQSNGATWRYSTMFSGIHNLPYPSFLYAEYCIIESRGGKFILCGEPNSYSKE